VFEGLFVTRRAGRSNVPPERPPSFIVGLDEFPAFVGLALDVGFSRLALGIKRIKVLFEAVSYGTIPELRHVAKVFLHS